MTPFPDYGTPGAPNMDPYYLSPAQQAALETAQQIVRDELYAGLIDIVVIATTRRDASHLTAAEVADVIRSVLAEHAPDVLAALTEAR